MRRVLRAIKVVALCISLFTLPLSFSSTAVEFGQDATGDPNAVHIQGNVSGFLYSERIILTAAHVLNQLKIQPNGDTQGFVYAPGLADKTNAKKYQIIKAIIPKTYVNADPARNIQPIDDFAIVIINEDMPLKNKVVIASEKQMRQFAQDKVKVEMVGYGLQSGAQRVASQPSPRAPFKLTTLLYTPEMMNTFYATKKLNRGDDKPGFWTVVEWGAIHTQATGSICNGDSGSGFFVEENNVRYYVGTTGNGVGISNCQSDGSIKMDPDGGMSWFPAPYKFLDLIEYAETFVAEEKRKEFAKAEEARLAAELKAKQEAEAKAKVEAEAKAKSEEEAKLKAEEEAKSKAEEEAKSKAEEEARAKAEAEAKAKLEAAKKKTTITCVKGKLTKKVSAVKPKCPSGYKKK
jgi:hypothetical protein